MKVKTGATLSSEFLERIDLVNPNRSSFLEQAALLYLERETKIRDAKDGKILERYAEPGRADPMD